MQPNHHKMVITKRYKFSRWSIKLPLTWQAERIGYCVTFTAEKGIGTLQIITCRPDKKDVTYNNLHGFTEDKLVDSIDLQNVRCGDFTGTGISYLVDGNYWRKWWLWKDSVLLFITYNCSAEERLVEIDLVDQMMNSLKNYPF